MAEATAQELEKSGLSVGLINPRFIKPLDAELILAEAKKAKVICTFEDHVLLHGFGASIIELLHENGIKTPVERIGWPDEFVEHGKPEILRANHGLTVENALKKVKAHFPSS